MLRRRLGAVGPDGGGLQLPPGEEPDRGRVGTEAHPEDLRHPRQHVLGGVGIADALGELRQHLVRIRAAPEDPSICERRCEPSQWPEGEPQRDPNDEQSDRLVPQPAACPDRDGTDHEQADHDGRDQERDEDGIPNGLPDDQVDLVEAVAKDRHADRERDQREREHDERLRGREPSGGLTA